MIIFIDQVKKSLFYPCVSINMISTIIRLWLFLIITNIFQSYNDRKQIKSGKDAVFNNRGKAVI